MNYEEKQFLRDEINRLERQQDLYKRISNHYGQNHMKSERHWDLWDLACKRHNKISERLDMLKDYLEEIS